MISLIERARKFSDRTAIISEGHSFTYADLERRSAEIAADLLNGDEDLNEARIAFLLPPGFDYVATQWAIWRAGGIAVPLCEKHPTPSLQYVTEDTSAAAVIYGSAYRELLEPLF